MSLLDAGEGAVKLHPQHEEDMWHIFNLVAVGDTVSTVSFRKVQKESSTGSSSSNKVANEPREWMENDETTKRWK